MVFVNVPVALETVSGMVVPEVNDVVAGVDTPAEETNEVVSDTKVNDPLGSVMGDFVELSF